MGNYLAIELYKLSKKWQQGLFVLVLLVAIPLCNAIYIKYHFESQFQWWARLSKDPNPYNFLITKIGFSISMSTLLCLILWGLLITSSEFREGTVARLRTSSTGFTKILMVKTGLLIMLGIINLLICLVIGFVVYRDLPGLFSATFTGFTFISRAQQLEFMMLFLGCIIKVSLFHQVVMVLSGKYYYVPIAIGLLSIFFYFYNFLPYGMLYSLLKGLRNFTIDNTFVGFIWVSVVFVIFFSPKFQCYLTKIRII